MNPAQINELTSWILEQVKSHDFGEINISIRLRDGRPQILQRAFTENVILTTGNTGGHHDRNR